MRYNSHLNGTNSQVQRALNKAMILHLLSVFGPLTRQDIVKKVKLTSGAVTNIISSLEQRGIVREASIEDYDWETQPGRRPVPLEIDAEARLAIGINITEHGLNLGLFNLKGKLIYTPENVYKENFEPTEVVKYINDIINKIKKNFIAKGKQLLGICMIAPGLVDSEKGVIKVSPRLGWEKVPMGDMLEDATGLPCIIENSMRGWTAQELCFNYIDTHESFISIYAGDGIGAGIVVDGKILRGSSFEAGEFGHMIVDPNGPECSCGTRGCLESVASIEPFMNKVLGKIGCNIKGSFDYHNPDHYALYEEVITLVEKGNQEVLKVVSETAKYIGIAISNVVNLLNPDYIVVTGSVFNLPTLLGKVEECIDKFTFRSPEEKLKVYKKKTNKLTWAKGAAAVVFTRLFFNPSAHL